MRTAVIVGPVAVTTEYWEESREDGTREAGCRVELRRVRQTPPDVPSAYPRKDAVFWSIAEHLWRADLFSTVGGNRPFDAAHYHPTFKEGVPSDRHLEGQIDDPYAWIAARLDDVPQILDEAGHGELAAELDVDALRQAMPAILASIRATLDYIPSRPWTAPAAAPAKATQATPEARRQRGDAGASHAAGGAAAPANATQATPEAQRQRGDAGASHAAGGAAAPTKATQAQ